MRRRLPKKLLCLSLSLGMLAGCGGGGGAGVSPTAQAQQDASAGASRTYPLTGGATLLALPPVGGFTGALAIPAATVPTGTSLTLTTSLQAPGETALQDLQRHLESTQATQTTGQLNVYFYMKIVATATITFPTVPGFSVVLPSSIDPSGQLFSYAIQQKAGNGAELSFRTEGPATVSGHTVTFTPSAKPLTLQAGQSYIVAFYSTAVPAGNTQHLYVLNTNTFDPRTAPKVTVYPVDANGNVAPARTISGNKTGFYNPSSLTVDGSGYLYVLNLGVAPEAGSITVYAPGANGNVPPIRTIAGSNTLLSDPGSAAPGSYGLMALDGRGNVAVINQTKPPPGYLGGNDEIDFYDAQGNGNISPRRTIFPDDGYSFDGLAGNGTGELAADEFTGATNNVNVYASDASGHSAPLRAVASSRVQSIAFASNGQLAVVSEGDGFVQIIVFAAGANGNAQPLRDITQLVNGFEIVGQIAFNAGGDIAAPIDLYTSAGGLPSYQISIYGPKSTLLLDPARAILGSATALNQPVGVAFGP